MLPLLTVTAALAVMVAPDAKVVAALTVRVWVDEVPRTVFPLAVRVEVGLVRVTPPEKLARPELSMVRRSVGWPLLLVLPAVVVLNTRLPPVFPVASCSISCGIRQACPLRSCHQNFISFVENI